jgi:hypothetical protein
MEKVPDKDREYRILRQRDRHMSFTLRFRNTLVTVGALGLLQESEKILRKSETSALRETTSKASRQLRDACES